MIYQWSDDRTGYACFSDDMTMRYLLGRALTDDGIATIQVWRDAILGDHHDVAERVRKLVRRVVFLMLNPSTADAFVLDPTIKRCMAFARAWGADVLEVVNLFALRATDPQELYKRAWGRRGDDLANIDTIIATCSCAFRVIVGWGKHGSLDGRDKVVTTKLLACEGVQLHHLGLNKDGSPKHPLYIRGGTDPMLWTP